MSDNITGILRALAEREREPLTFRQCENLHYAAETIDLLRASIEELDGKAFAVGHVLGRAGFKPEDMSNPAKCIEAIMQNAEKLMAERDAARAALAKREAVPVKEYLTTVPSDVMAALDRMCTPLDDSWLGTATETAKADARSMALIRSYIMSGVETDRAPADAHALLDEYERRTKELPIQHEMPSRGQCTYIHFQCEEEQGRMYEEMRHAVGVADGTPHEEAVKTAAALADSEVTENLVALVGRLSYALRKANPANGLPTKAMSYLEGAGFKFHAARTSEIDSRSAETPFAEAVKKLEITASGHAVGADKSGDRYQIGFARGFHACWKQFAELFAASQQAAKGEGGMTLRDYFAAKALVGEICAQSEETGYYSDLTKLARHCYGIADAMIAARATPSGEGRE